MESFIKLIRNKFPSTCNWPGISRDDESYNKSQETHENLEHKKTTRERIIGIHNVVSKDKEDGWAFILDCEKFNVTTMLNSSTKITHTLVPNWNAKDITNAGNKRYACLDKSKCSVLGAPSYEVVKFMCSLDSDQRPQFSLIWLDTCNKYLAEQENEIWNMFEYGLVSKTTAAVFAGTYVSNFDLNGPLIQDKKTNTAVKSREHSLIMRIKEAATTFNYTVVEAETTSHHGMVTVWCVVRYQDEKKSELAELQYELLRYNGIDKLFAIKRSPEIRKISKSDYLKLIEGEKPAVAVAPRKRGRPKKSAPTEAPAQPEPRLEPPRKRGRPKKNVVAVVLKSPKPLLPKSPNYYFTMGHSVTPKRHTPRATCAAVAAGFTNGLVPRKVGVLTPMCGFCQKNL